MITSALAVSTLYWAQSVVGQATAELGPSALIALAPGATLLGYACGVAALATFARDLSRPGGLIRHGAWLAAALLLAAASNASLLAIACFFTGAGAALTQRLLVIATTLMPDARRSQAIGLVISSGLAGIVFARSCVTGLAALIGWRQMFAFDALATGLACLVAAWLCPAGQIATGQRPDLPSPLRLLRAKPDLRSAAVQQAAVFAVFNMGWSLFPAATHARPGILALIASIGAAAALLTGRACRTVPARIMALAGFSAVAVASIGAVLVYAAGSPSFTPGLYAAMLLLEVGTQIALVANQARAQASASSVPMRGRLASILTTIGFGGGAAGAALGNLLLATMRAP